MTARRMSFLRTVFSRFANPDRRGQPIALSSAEWRLRGNAALAGGKLAEASECYQQAARIDPQDALAHLNLGFVLLEQGDAAAAETPLLAAIALRRPDQQILHEIHYLLGRTYGARGDARRATASLEAAAEALPSFTAPMKELVQLLHQCGSHERALEWARRLQSVRTDP